MSVTRMIPVAPGASLDTIISIATQNLQTQGYEVIPTVMGPTSASLVVKKDRDGFKNVVGLGVEVNATIVMNGPSLNVSFAHEWTNKIVAVAVGWFLCLVPFITGIVGCVNQNDLPEKIASALTAAGNAGTQFTPQQ